MSSGSTHSMWVHLILLRENRSLCSWSSDWQSSLHIATQWHPQGFFSLALIAPRHLFSAPNAHARSCEIYTHCILMIALMPNHVRFINTIILLQLQYYDSLETQYEIWHPHSLEESTTKQSAAGRKRHGCRPRSNPAWLLTARLWPKE